MERHRSAVRCTGILGEELEVVVGLEGDGEVDEVQVEVVQPELGQAVVQRGLDVGGGVLAVPELGGDPELIAALASLLEESLDAIAN